MRTTTVRTPLGTRTTKVSRGGTMRRSVELPWWMQLLALGRLLWNKTEREKIKNMWKQQQEDYKAAINQNILERKEAVNREKRKKKTYIVTFKPYQMAVKKNIPITGSMSNSDIYLDRNMRWSLPKVISDKITSEFGRNYFRGSHTEGTTSNIRYDPVSKVLSMRLTGDSRGINEIREDFRGHFGDARSRKRFYGSWGPNTWMSGDPFEIKHNGKVYEIGPSFLNIKEAKMIERKDAIDKEKRKKKIMQQMGG